MTGPEIIYDPAELCFRVVGDATRGPLLHVHLWPDSPDVEYEVGFLLRVPDDGDPDELIEAACRYWLVTWTAGDEGDWEYDWGHATDGTSGLWTPSPHPDLKGPPMERQHIGELFRLSEPPLGATRGRAGSSEDFRWVWTSALLTTVEQPLKRASAMRSELHRVLAKPQSWGRISWPLRHDPETVLRVSPGPTMALVLMSLRSGTSWPCRARVDFDTMINWLDKELG